MLFPARKSHAQFPAFSKVMNFLKTAKFLIDNNSQLCYTMIVKQKTQIQEEFSYGKMEMHGVWGDRGGRARP